MTTLHWLRGGRFLQRGAFALLLAFPACSGDDDDDAAANSGNYGTCDLRDAQKMCIEATGPVRSIGDQRDGCLGANGAWSTSPCPETSDLLGCCEYTFGNQFRQCFYVGTSYPDPQAYCLDTTLWQDGVWTPAGS